MADSAPPLLTAFIYYMTRDLIPPRYVESVLEHIRAFPDHQGDTDLWAYADKIARRIMFEPGSADGSPQVVNVPESG